MKTAIYPGTFDPITFGHIDVIKKSLNNLIELLLLQLIMLTKTIIFQLRKD